MGCRRPTTPRGLPQEQGLGAPALPRCLAPVARGTGKGARQRRKALPAGRSGSAEHNREQEATATARPYPRHAGCLVPKARPSQPLLQKFLFCFAPPEKCGPGEGAEDSPRRARRKWCPRERGRAEEMPAPPAPALAARPGPPPRRDFGGPSPARHWRRRRQMWPRLPQRANNAGPAKQKGSASPPSRPLTYTLGEPRGIPGRQGPRPQGPRATRAPTCLRRPRSLLPPPRPPHRHKACRTPVCSDSWSPGIRPYCPRGALRARPRSPAAPARVPTGLQEQAGGAKETVARRRRRCPPDAAALRVFLSFFFPILMGRKVTAYFAFINSHHNKNPSAKGGQQAQSVARVGGLYPPLRRASTPERSVRTRGRGR